MIDERYTLHRNGSTPAHGLTERDDEPPRLRAAWMTVLIDRLSLPIRLLCVVLSLAAWWLLAEAVDATLSSTYKWQVLSQLAGGG